VAFRNRSPNEVRDIYTSRRVEGPWTDPVPVHDELVAHPRVPGERAGSQRPRAPRRARVAHRAARPGSCVPCVLRRCCPHVQRPDPRRRCHVARRVDVELLPDGSAVVTWIEFAEHRASCGAAHPAVWCAFRVHHPSPDSPPAVQAATRDSRGVTPSCYLRGPKPATGTALSQPVRRSVATDHRAARKEGAGTAGAAGRLVLQMPGRRLPGDSFNAVSA
jgi:hypothetical protein